MWALGAGGRSAVANFLRSTVADLTRTLALMGVTSVDALASAHVDTRFARR
jgi:isopentenyl diphosphate isomerase/L-lactate dehydrogenase-like FMN-dependent dehydrogenase